VNNLSMPQWCPFFLDPKAVISAYTGCKLNCKHSKLDGYGMESVWCYAMQQLSLPNAHNSLADCRAQMDIVLHKHFHSYLNKKKSIAKFDDIWLAKKRKHSEISSEATRKVPPGWNEDNSIAWDIPVEKQCGNTAGSSKISQPSPAVLDAIASQEHSPLVNLFYFSSLCHCSKKLLMHLIFMQEKNGWYLLEKRMPMECSHLVPIFVLVK